MAIVFSCGSCGKKLTAKDEHAGKRAKCSACGGVTRIPSQPTREADDSPPVPSPKPAVDPRGLPDPTPPPLPSATKPCPYCAEDIKVEAKKCRHCGEILDPVLRAAQEAGRLATQRIEHRASPFPSLPPRKARWKLGCIGWIVIIVVVLLAIGELSQLKPIDVIEFLVGAAFAVLIVYTYFFPAILASGRNHPQRYAIGILNFFFGWTFLGWVIALVWAATAIPQSHARAGRR